VLFGVAVLDSYYIDGVWFLYRLEDTYTPAWWRLTLFDFQQPEGIIVQTW
jgi:hypothetical protein